MARAELRIIKLLQLVEGDARAAGAEGVMRSRQITPVLDDRVRQHRTESRLLSLAGRRVITGAVAPVSWQHRGRSGGEEERKEEEAGESTLRIRRRGTTNAGLVYVGDRCVRVRRVGHLNAQTAHATLHACTNLAARSARGAPAEACGGVVRRHARVQSWRARRPPRRSPFATAP